MPEGADPGDEPTVLGDIEEIKPEVVSPKPPNKPPSGSACRFKSLGASKSTW